jgi:hypothetical protein
LSLACVLACRLCDLLLLLVQTERARTVERLALRREAGVLRWHCESIRREWAPLVLARLGPEWCAPTAGARRVA